MERSLILLTYLADSNASVAEVTYHGQEKYPGQDQPVRFTVTGSSKRERGDKNIPAVAEDLAVSRALRTLADKLEARATRTVERECDNHPDVLNGLSVNIHGNPTFYGWIDEIMSAFQPKLNVRPR